VERRKGLRREPRAENAKGLARLSGGSSQGLEGTVGSCPQAMIASDPVGPAGASLPRPREVDCDSPTDIHHCAQSANSRLRQRADCILREPSTRTLGERRGGTTPCLTGPPLHSRGRSRSRSRGRHSARRAIHARTLRLAEPSNAAPAARTEPPRAAGLAGDVDRRGGIAPRGRYDQQRKRAPRSHRLHLLTEITARR
jgi:hypothetical protein